MANLNEVVRYGTDTSGRAIYMTLFMRDWWFTLVAELGFEPTIVQGAFMVKAGGGATESAGYHDGGGCLDLRTWDLTDDQVGKVVRTLRRHGAAAWKRDKAHGGMDEHIHFVLSADFLVSAGAKSQWVAYVAGLDGLATRGKDYHWRPEPLVLTPPVKAPAPTPSITAAKTAMQALRKALNTVARKGSPEAAKEAATVKARLDGIKAWDRLKAQEVKAPNNK